MVARTSSGVSGRSLGSSALASVAPMTWPIFMPPPARTTDMAPGQWSRPASLLIRGVRPNSPQTRTSVSSHQAAVVHVSRSGPTRAWSYSGSFFVLSDSKLLACVSQPPASTVTKVTPASTSRRASSRLWPSLCGRSGRGWRSLPGRSSNASLRGRAGDHLERLAREGVEAVHQARPVAVAAEGVDRLEQDRRLASRSRLTPLGSVRLRTEKLSAVRVAADGERVIADAEVAGRAAPGRRPARPRRPAGPAGAARAPGR